MQAAADDDHEARGRLHPHELPFVLMAASHVSQELANLSGRRVGRRSAAHYRQVSVKPVRFGFAPVGTLISEFEE